MISHVVMKWLRHLAVCCGLLVLPLVLTGCLSYLFVETVTRLQLENATGEYSILSLDVVALDGSVSSPWITETVLPGERSRVVERDWIGEFKIRVKYTESKDASGDTLEDYRVLDFEGGSMFLKVEADDGKLEYHFR